MHIYINPANLSYLDSRVDSRATIFRHGCVFVRARIPVRAYMRACVRASSCIFARAARVYTALHHMPHAYTKGF